VFNLMSVLRRRRLQSLQAHLERVKAEHKQTLEIVGSGNRVSADYLDQLIYQAGQISYYAEKVRQYQAE
jgi:hypothetical protein